MKSPAADLLKSVKPNVLLALLAMAAAGWFGWQGVQASKVEALGEEAGRVRAEVALKLGERLQAAIAQLDSTRTRIALATALGRGDTMAANDLITESWTGVEAVEWHAPGLDAAYADPQAFGYGKLGVLELALQQNATQAAVVKDAGGPRLHLRVDRSQSRRGYEGPRQLQPERQERHDPAPHPRAPARAPARPRGLRDRVPGGARARRCDARRVGRRRRPRG